MADSNDTSPFNPGDQFGDYTVERLLGRGSMGSVYLMRSPDGSPFAVKIMHRGMMSPDMRVRFVREAESMMDVRHRNLVSVYDAGEDPDTGLCYIIMDYMPGGTLADMIKARGRIPVGDAVKIAMHIAAALDVVHRSGLVHRDVKPDNIMFAADGTPKLADLGVAKFGDERNTMVTMTGMVIGTPAYMAPEQLMDSHKIDARADIYSLGVILYEMLSGKRPNSGSTSVELLAKAIKGEPLPDIRTMRPETSAAVAHVLSLMCAPKPDDRPETAVAAAQILRKAATGKFFVLPNKSPKSSEAVDVEKAIKRKRIAHNVLGGIGLLIFIIFFTVGITYSVLRDGGQQKVLDSVIVTNVIEKVEFVTNLVGRASVVTNVVKEGALVSGATATQTEAHDKAKIDLAQVEKGESPAERSGLRVLVPRLDRDAGAWAYSFNEEQGWQNPDFNDLSWERAQGGFGQYGNDGRKSNMRVGTTWSSERIFLRRRFDWSGGDLSRAVVDVYHDGDVVMHLNGMFILAINDANSDWEPFEIPLERFAKAIRNGGNVLCVEVRNTATKRCRYFDCGLFVERGGVPVANAGPDCVRKIKTSVGTWTIVVKDGMAQIGNDRTVALDPRPKGKLEIPGELDGFKVRKLARDCFKRCDELESVIIPEGVLSVGQGAFSESRMLVEVFLPESLEHIGRWPFSGTKIRRIDIKNVRMLGEGAFRQCNNLDKVFVGGNNLTYREKGGILYDMTRRAVVFCPRSRKSCALPNGIEEICDSSFQCCKIRSMAIPATVETIGDRAFNGCQLLETVRFGGDDAFIGEWAFSETPSLRSVELPPRLRSLGSPAVFMGAGRLESIVLPDTVKTIGERVFERCSKLRSIKLGRTLSTVGFRAFLGCSHLRKIDFPKTLKELGAEVFRNCTSLDRVTFAGDAPLLVDEGNISGDDIYDGANPSLTTIVPVDAKGWTDYKGMLPKVWPEAAGEFARAIRFANGRRTGGARK